jgi:hypothetical protein
MWYVDMIKLSSLKYQINRITNVRYPYAAVEALNLATHGLGQVQSGAALQVLGIAISGLEGDT